MSRAKTLGILGGGQLGRMFVQAAQAMGFRVVVLCPDPGEPAAQISDEVIVADYSDTAALAQLAEQCCAVTTEFENVPADALAFLAEPNLNLRVAPKAAAVRIAQDRILEKAHFKASGVLVAPYCVIDSEAALHGALHGLNQLKADFYPAILKTTRMGYDGKGQVTVLCANDLAVAWQGLSCAVCVLEKRMPLVAECSVLLARQTDSRGTAFTTTWPVQTNVHVKGILASTEVAAVNAGDSHSESFAQSEPAQAGVDRVLQASMLLAAQNIATQLDYQGVLCIEFFVLADGSWVVNEMAPRPHNSGHVTMNASSISQFEAQVRVAAGLPLVPARQHSSVVMVNLLGDVWFDSAKPALVREPNWAAVLAFASKDVGVHLHLYGKAEPRPARKMGHINVTAQTLAQARLTALQIQQALGIVSKPHHA